MKFTHGVGLRSAGLLTLAATLTLACWTARDGGAAQRGAPGRDAAEAGGEQQQHLKVREGTILEANGSFRITGERALFTTEDGARYSGLENLNLERVAIATSESPDPLVWSVTGTVTEFRGSNYLLITRAMLKTKATAPNKRSAGIETAKPRAGKPAEKS